MLEPEAWSEVRLIHEAVLSLRVEMNGTTYTYRDICAGWRGECYTNSILSFADIFAFLREGIDRYLLYTVQYCTLCTVLYTVYSTVILYLNLPFANLALVLVVVMLKTAFFQIKHYQSDFCFLIKNQATN